MSKQRDLSKVVDTEGASKVGFDPTGNILSTNVQLAIQELDTEKAVVGHNHDDSYYSLGNNFTFRNKIINGGMDVWQRGTSQSVGGYGSVDRWYFGAAGGSLSVAKGQDVQPVSGSQYGNYCTVTGTAAVGGYFLQHIEDVRTLANRTVTLSFERTLISGTDTGDQPKLQQRFGTGGSSSVDIVATSDVTVGTKRILTFNVPTIAGKTIGDNSSLIVIIPFAGTFYRAYWNFQLEEGSIATPFEQRPAGLELSLCQRYFHKAPVATIAGGFPRLNAYGGAGQNPFFYVNYPVTMRTYPTITVLVSGGWSLSNCSAPLAGHTTQNTLGLYVIPTSTGTFDAYPGIGNSPFSAEAEL